LIVVTHSFINFACAKRGFALFYDQLTELTYFMALSKYDIVSKMCSSNPEISRVEHAAHFNTVINAITDLIVEGNDVTITKFGSFKTRQAAERTVKNHLAGKEIVIPASKRVSFKPSATLKSAINQTK